MPNLFESLDGMSDEEIAKKYPKHFSGSSEPEKIPADKPEPPKPKPGVNQAPINTPTRNDGNGIYIIFLYGENDEDNEEDLEYNQYDNTGKFFICQGRHNAYNVIRKQLSLYSYLSDCNDMDDVKEIINKSFVMSDRVNYQQRLSLTKFFRFCYQIYQDDEYSTVAISPDYTNWLLNQASIDEDDEYDEENTTPASGVGVNAIITGGNYDGTTE